MVQLETTIAKLNDDELRVVALIAKRLAEGRRVYGPMDLQGDPRDFESEAMDEAADLAAYLAMRWVQRALTRRTEGG